MYTCQETSPHRSWEKPPNGTSVTVRTNERSGNDVVRCAIEQLPVILREVILLCDVEDASYREMAEILSIPIGTVMSRLARARKAVRKTVRGEEILRKAAL
jgi:RNA polymerase sigma factor (sigma-70 family)